MLTLLGCPHSPLYHVWPWKNKIMLACLVLCIALPDSFKFDAD